MNYNTKPFNSWKELREFLDQFGGMWVYRGQCNSEWALESSIDRFAKSNEVIEMISKKYVEYAMLDKLEREIGTVAKIDSKQLENNFQKISFLQHHGAPTRLLDVTTSPYVGLFFAMEKCTSEAALFAISGLALNAQNVVNYNKGQVKDKMDSSWGALSKPEVFDRIVMEHKQSPLVGFVQPYYLFDRIRTQSGCFLVQGDIDRTFEENLKVTISAYIHTSETIYKMVIPASLRHDILRELNKMNINRASLFPGLDGYIQSISENVVLNLANGINNFSSRPKK